MNVWAARLISLLTVAAFALFFLMAGLSISSLVLNQSNDQVDVILDVVSLVKLSPLEHSKHDRASFIFSLKTDLRPLFHWNVKQLFVYLIARYTSDQHSVNEVVVWDRIVTNPKEALIAINKLRNKYPIVDYGNSLLGVTVSFEVRWQVIPYSGRVVSQSSRSEQWKNFTLPNEYKTAMLHEDFLTYEDTH